MSRRLRPSHWIAVVSTPKGGLEVLRVTATPKPNPTRDDRTEWHALAEHPAAAGRAPEIHRYEEHAVLDAVMNPGIAWRWRLVSLARARPETA